MKGIRALAALYPEVVHIVARADAGIRTVADLKGKRVVVGDVGSGTEQNARQILEPTASALRTWARPSG